MQQLIQKKQEPKYMPKKKKETRGGKRSFSGRKKSDYLVIDENNISDISI